MADIYYSRFVVNEKPYCVWEWDLPQRNRDFIDRIDSEYFNYVARSTALGLEGDDRQRAAVTIRSAYSHGLETLFSLLFAALQAPDCIVGWILKYSLNDLRALSEKVGSGQSFLTKVRIAGPLWEGIAATIHEGLQHADYNPGDKFGRLWARFASDFLDDEQTFEYNSIKHGFRIAPGGFTLRKGREPELGQPAPPEAMRTLGSSKFGSTFYIPEKLFAGQRHFRVRRKSRNWIPENQLHGLRLISVSIGNILAFIRHNQGAEEVQYNIPNDVSYFREPWRRSPGVVSTGLDYRVEEEDVSNLSDEDILAVYKTESQESDGEPSG